MIFAVLTNDLHQKVFYFPKGFFFSNEVYEYRFIFILIQIWMMLCLMIMEVVLMRKSAASKKVDLVSGASGTFIAWLESLSYSGDAIY